jgi:hypothetical protein
MRRFNNLSFIGLFLVIFLFSLENAYAYLDPGTGSFILQVMLGILLGAAFTIKIYWRNILAFFKRIFSKKGNKDG